MQTQHGLCSIETRQRFPILEVSSYDYSRTRNKSRQPRVHQQAIPKDNTTSRDTASRVVPTSTMLLLSRRLSEAVPSAPACCHIPGRQEDSAIYMSHYLSTAFGKTYSFSTHRPPNKKSAQLPPDGTRTREQYKQLRQIHKRDTSRLLRSCSTSDACLPPRPTRSRKAVDSIGRLMPMP